MDWQGDDLPFDVRMVTPGTPEYEASKAAWAESDRNLEYFLQHELELMERHRDEIVLIYDSDKVMAFSDPDEYVDFVLALDEPTRSAALNFSWPPEGTAWAL